jgi:hypothetical protein
VLAGLNLVRPEMTHNNDGQPGLVRLTQYGGLAWPKLGLGCGARRALAHHAEGAGVMARWRGRGRLVGGQDVTRAAKKWSTLHREPIATPKATGKAREGGAPQEAGSLPAFSSGARQTTISWWSTVVWSRPTTGEAPKEV